MTQFHVSMGWTSRDYMLQFIEISTHNSKNSHYNPQYSQSLTRFHVTMGWTFGDHNPHYIDVAPHNSMNSPFNPQYSQSLTQFYVSMGWTSGDHTPDYIDIYLATNNVRREQHPPRFTKSCFLYRNKENVFTGEGKISPDLNKFG